MWEKEKDVKRGKGTDVEGVSKKGSKFLKR